MKNAWKRLLGVAIALTLLLGSLTMIGWADDEEAAAPPVLKFNDGAFKILHITDLEEKYVMGNIAEDFLKDVIREVKPDLVVLGGDNFDGAGMKRLLQFSTRRFINRMIDNLMGIFAELDVPVTTVFGDLDVADTGIIRFQQLQRYKEFDNFVGYDFDLKDYAGTHSILLKDSDGEDDVFTLWLFDSGSWTADGGFPAISMTEFNAAKNAAARALPSIAFQHIAPREIYSNLDNVSDFDPIPAHAVSRKFATLGTDGKFRYEEIPSEEEDGEPTQGGILGLLESDPAFSYVLPATARGLLRVAPNTSYATSRQLSATGTQNNPATLRTVGTMALFFGHDHINEFVIDAGGIDLVATPTAAYNGKRDSNCGVRLITISEGDDDFSYATEMITYKGFYKDRGAGLLPKVRIWRSDMYASIGNWANLFDWLFYKPWIWFWSLFD
ncbi:MAG: metallophosphoesterase [Oscillospiraceae bacterium]|nr:metallophosphoesterase [Oscillospiraceae bacterium]